MTISKTFCPAKWDEILVNLSANYVYSCCKSVPVQITRKEDINIALNKQKENLLNGIQDPACNYCWVNENQGYESLRYQYLNTFDQSKSDEYKNNTVTLKKIEVSIGNECNFQCTYCNPKFSSQWESDVKIKPYKIYSDRFFYAVEGKSPNNIAETKEWLKDISKVDLLEIIGGEPLQNKNFFNLINSIDSNYLGFTTNLSCKNTNPIDRILKLSNRYTGISLRVSIDSTGKNAEFSRYGMKYDNLLRNINYLLTSAPSNVKIGFNSLMTSITIRDFDNMVDLIDTFYEINSNIHWNIMFCRDPNILTLNTLPDKFKPKLLEKIESLKDRKYINGLKVLEGAIKSSKFNTTLYNQMKHFLNEFSDRKNIPIPMELE